MFAVDLLLIGFGNVAQRFVRLLGERASQLRRQHELDWRIVGIATKHHGAARDPLGLDPARAASLVAAGASLDALDAAGSFPGRLPSSVEEITRQVAAATRKAGGGRELVVVETTVLDIAAGQPATDFVRAALVAGAHVVTANKGPVAFAYAELDALARSSGVRFLFEGAVMDGIPVFNLVRRTLPGVDITGFSGVLNSTTNYILTAMENGREFGDSLADMQATGIAEADASLDVDGWDAAAKAAALANVLMGARLTPHLVERGGIGHLTGADLRAAASRGRRVRLVARGVRRDGQVVARVAAEEVPASHLFATLHGQQNALVLETDLLGEFSIVQLGGGLTQTAYALMSDLLALAEPGRADGPDRFR